MRSRERSTEAESALAYPGWRVVGASVFGVMLGYAVLVPYTFSLFIKPLAEAVNFVDPQSGMDYLTAGTLLSKDVDANNRNPNAQVQAIPYWEHLFPQLARNGMSATPFIYTKEWSQYRYTTGETHGDSRYSSVSMAARRMPKETRFRSSGRTSLRLYMRGPRSG